MKSKPLLYFDKPTNLLSLDGRLYISLADAAKEQGVSLPTMRTLYKEKMVMHKGYLYIELDIFKDSIQGGDNANRASI